MGSIRGLWLPWCIPRPPTLLGACRCPEQTGLGREDGTDPPASRCTSRRPECMFVSSILGEKGSILGKWGLLNDGCALPDLQAEPVWRASRCGFRRPSCQKVPKYFASLD